MMKVWTVKHYETLWNMKHSFCSAWWEKNYVFLSYSQSITTKWRDFYFAITLIITSTVFECFIWRWAQSASQWQLYSTVVVVDRFYTALFSTLKQTHCVRMRFYEWLAFYSAFFEYPPKWCTYSAGMAVNCSHLGASSMHTIQPCSMSLHAKPHM